MGRNRETRHITPTLLMVPKIGIAPQEAHPMRKSTSFSLGDHFVAFIEEQVAGGRYGTASDVVRAGLRLLEDQETKLATLRAALIESEAGTASTLFDFENFIARR